MTWRTHLIGGAQVGVAAAYIAGGSFGESALIISSALLGSVLPDIDQPGSKLAKSDSLVGFMSLLVSRFTKHRGITHTVIGAALIAMLFYILAMFRTDKESVFAFLIAMSVFALVHVAGGIFSRLAGWLAVICYAFAPQIMQVLSEHSVSFSVNARSAALCAAGIFLGCISHIVYDAFNKGGVMLLYPFSKKTFRFLDIRTNTFAEFGFAGVQVLVLALLIAVLYRDVRIVNAVRELVDELSNML